MAEEFGYLKLLTNVNAAWVPITKKVTTFGRSSKCDFKLAGNQYISGDHCRLEVNGDEVWLSDTSSNGVLIEGKGKINKEKVKLEDGDQFHLVKQTLDTNWNVGYKFQRNMSSNLDGTFKIEYAEEIVDKEEKEKSITEKSEDPKQTDDAMADVLLCIICQDIFHKCISVLPCMHTFCEGCYTEWSHKTNWCPSCRGIVETTKPNHVINNVVEAYLDKHPEQKRSDEELQALDMKSKMKSEETAVAPPQNDNESDDYESDGYDYDEDIYGIVSDSVSYDEDGNSIIDLDDDDGYDHDLMDSDDNDEMRYHGGNDLYTNILGLDYSGDDDDDDDGDFYSADVDMGGGNKERIPLKRSARSDDNDDASKAKLRKMDVACRQCTRTAEVGQQGNSRQVDFVCPVNQTHILCTCCLEPMPLHQLNQFPPQKCAVCLKSFCHMYWGCRSPSCLGCLGLFKDMTFPKTTLDILLLDNAFESNILKNYLQSKSINADQFFKDLVDQGRRGILNCPDKDAIITRNEAVCRCCANKNLAELAYDFRSKLKADDLPASRPDCYWGRFCRTQTHRQPHAEKYNHICAQTRF